MCAITAPSVVLLQHTTGLTKDRGRGSTREKASNGIKTQHVCFTSHCSDFYLLFLGEEFLFLLLAVISPLHFSSDAHHPGLMEIIRSGELILFLGACLPSKFSQVLRALHVTEVITGLSSLIICIGKSLLLQKELWKRERYLNVSGVNFYIHLCVCVHL